MECKDAFLASSVAWMVRINRNIVECKGRKTGSATITATYLFTFHDVSINTMRCIPFARPYASLHSTMLLLIPGHGRKDISTFSVFTFHDVSINTEAV